MRNLTFTAVLLLFSVAAHAQKIGYADINAIIGVMPENEKVNEDLQIYAIGLQKRLDDLRGQQEQFGQQFQRALAAKDTATAIGIQEKAIELDQQIQQSTQQAERQLQQKRAEMMQPALDRIKKALEAVAKRDGFAYIINSVDGSGTSSVLYGPEEHNVTMKLVDELGIKLNDQQPVQAAPVAAPAQQGGKKK
jgi:outer membrane protein